MFYLSMKSSLVGVGMLVVTIRFVGDLRYVVSSEMLISDSRY